MKKFLLAVALACATLIDSVHAAVPATINYQGYLANPGGTPINTAVSMTFRIYDSAGGPNVLWSETQGSVNVSNGSFNVLLGSATPINLPFDIPYWFSVAVNADAEMTPRQPLASSPYAFRAGSLDSAATITGSQVTGTVTASVPAANIVGQLAPSNLNNLQLLPTSPCNFGQIAKWNGNSWVCAQDDGIPGGATNFQVLATNFGPPAWTASPNISGTLTVQTGLELASIASITRNNTRFISANNGSTSLGLNAGPVSGGAGGNVSVGDSAMPGASGLNNTAIGAGAGANLGSGSNNTIIGRSAGGIVSSTSGNIIIGSPATSNSVSGYNDNIIIGGAGNAVDLRTIRIGTTGSSGHLQAYIAGVSANVVGGSTNVTIDASGHLGNNPSSRRFKDTITDMNEASSALMKLRPVTFYYKADRNPAGRELQYGLIAEEVNEVYPGLVAHDSEGQILTVMYQHLPPMLLNEFQKQQRTIQAQAAELAQARAGLEQVMHELREIRAALAAR